MEQPVRIKPAGRMDTDTDLLDVSGGNYLDAKNIRHKTTNGNSTNDPQNILGTEYVYTAGEWERQNKWVRIAVNATGAATPTITFQTYANGASYTTNPITVPINDVDTAIDNIVTESNAILLTFGFGGATEIDRVIDNNSFGNVVLELGGDTALNQGIDWVVTPTAPLTFLDVVREAIPEGLTGTPKCIGSRDINRNLFQDWTTQFELPDNRIVINASNTTPIVVDELVPHGLADGDLVLIDGVAGNTNANGLSLVNVTSSNSYELIGSAGNGVMQININSGLEYFSTGLIEITTAGAHGFSSNDSVYIQGSDATANGYWEDITVTSATTFVLEGSTFVAIFGPGGTVVKTARATHNPLGLGEIGVSVKNQDDTWTYTRLLRSRELNFRTKKQTDNRIELQNSVYGKYFTDFYNSPRVFYYTGAFVTDGAINYINPLGRYTYGSISEQLSLVFKEPVLFFSYEGQLQSGGALTSGNKRYAARLLTSSLDATGWSKLSPPINVYAETSANPTNILGNEANTLTSKANQIRISGINDDFFTYIEVAAVDYVGGSFTGQIIGRYTVPIGGEIVITHYGNEAGATELDLTTLNQLTTDIQTALSLELIDNLLVFFNITSTAEYDLEDWAQEANYSLLRTTIQGVGGSQDLSLGEYQDPENVFSFTSYMLNETYRFGIRLRNTNTGVWTRPYYSLDVTFDDTAPSGRRLAAIPDYDLTNTPTPPANADDVYVYYIQFENLNWDYALPNGRTIRQEYDYVEFVRSEVTTPTVLLNGVLVPKNDDLNPAFIDELASNCCVLNATGINTAPDFPYTAPANSVKRQSGALFSPDNIIGGNEVIFQSGDLLYTYGQPLFQTVNQTGTGAAPAPSLSISVLTELYGAFATTFSSHNLDGITPIAPNQTVSITGTTIDGATTIPAAGEFNAVINTLAFKINTTFITDTAGLMANDFAVYQFQYIRPNSNPYGSTGSTNYVSIGAIFEIANATSATQYNVFGGDCFTQKSWIRVFINPPSVGASYYGKIIGFYSQNRINSQMRNETGVTNQVIFPRADGGSVGNLNGRIDQVNAFSNAEPFEYNYGYSLPNLIQSDIAYDPAIPLTTEQPTRGVYSAVKPQNSLSDFYRVFPPLNFYDEDASNGAVMAIFKIGGELYTWQERAFVKQYVNARATIQGGGESNDILLTSGAVFSQRGRMISTIGCNHKWGCIIGKSLNGYDTAYWVNTELKKVMRFASDGTQNVSDVRLLRSFLANNLRWVDNKFTPADDEGICMGWDNRYSQLYITIRGRKTVSDYDNTVTYSKGQAVTYSPALYSRNFEQTGEIYEYINNSPDSGNLPTDTEFWTKISHNDNRYYNEYTLLYDEDRNAFECFISFKPNIYLQWSDKILTPRPVGTYSRVYEHDRGYYNLWYVEAGETLVSASKVAGSFTVTGVGTSFLSEFQVGYGIRIAGVTYIVTDVASNTSLTIDDIYIDSAGDVQTGTASVAFTLVGYVPVSQQLEHGYIQPILNWEPNSSKNFGAIMMNTDIVPYRIDFTTNQHVSYLEQNDFLLREDYYYSTIKNDSTATGLNNGDTSRLFGKWLKIKLTLRYLLFQALSDQIVKLRINQRNFRK